MVLCRSGIYALLSGILLQGRIESAVFWGMKPQTRC